MSQWTLGCLCVALALPAWADEQQACAAAAGRYLSGTVVSQPSFRHGHPQRGVELSHTIVYVQSDQDGNRYQVAIDNVFTAGYDQSEGEVPAPLKAIRPGERLSLCGKPFPRGIDWVHTNCGNTPTANMPNGWVKPLAANGAVGANMTGSTEYCRIFGHH